MRPLVNDSEYDELVELSADFETSIAPRLQRYLWLKWIWSDNYVSDWWEEYVYLSSRTPLMINSNYYGLDCVCKDEPFFKQVICVLIVAKFSANHYIISTMFRSKYNCIIIFTIEQASRAANIIYMMFNFRRLLLRQEPQPLMIQRIVPLCSAQYERLFNTTRIPDKKVDR